MKFQVEAVIKIHPIVDTVCIYADPEKTSVVALIVAIDAKIIEIGDNLGITSFKSKEELYNDETLVAFVLKEMIEMAKSQLERFETPRQIKVRIKNKVKSTILMKCFAFILWYVI